MAEQEQNSIELFFLHKNDQGEPYLGYSIAKPDSRCITVGKWTVRKLKFRKLTSYFSMYNYQSPNLKMVPPPLHTCTDMQTV